MEIGTNAVVFYEEGAIAPEGYPGGGSMSFLPPKRV